MTNGVFQQSENESGYVFMFAWTELELDMMSIAKPDKILFLYMQSQRLVSM